MSSGKKERVMIACSTFEVAKIVEPSIYYDVDKVYLIHYITERGKIYKEFYDEICNQLREWKPSITIVEDYNKNPVYDFTLMMSDIMCIIGKERSVEDKPDIFVNISSGTHEFTAAAVIASMMWDNIVAFTAPTEIYKVRTEDDMRDTYYKKDRKTPVGLTEKTKKPIRLSAYSIPQPDRKLVVGLGVLNDRLNNKLPISAQYMIKELSGLNLIELTLDESSKKDRPDQKCIMNYQRNFVDKWIDKGWIIRISKRELEITVEGKQILRTFRQCYDQ